MNALTGTTTGAGSGGLHMGRHCEADGCNRLDFLPFKCHLCQGTYCDTHTKFSFHKNCKGIQNNTVVECPVCMKPIGGTSTTMQSMTEINNIISAHIDSGCIDVAALESQQRKREKQCAGFTKPGVRCKEPHMTQCKQCQGQFCARHRFYEDHNCPAGNGSAKNSPNLSPATVAAKSKAAAAAQSRANSNNPSPRIGNSANGSSSSVNKDSVAVVCPVCRKEVDGVKSGMNPSQVNNVVNQHIDAGCPAPKKKGVLGWLGL
ncbi:zinc finger, AN1-type domain [Rhizoclosmatium sp. JEL0117]|nr:zinc finger, AN1-type domain [Rhizoclosmatium sp. JEL0117]